MNVIKVLTVLVHLVQTCNSLWKCNSFWVPFKEEKEEETKYDVVMDFSNCNISTDWLYVGLFTKPGVYEIELEAVGTIYYAYRNYAGKPKYEINDVIHKLYNREYFKDLKNDATIDDSKINIYGTLHKKRHYKIIVGNHNIFPTNSLLFQRKATCAPDYEGEVVMTYSLVVEPIRIPNKKCKPIARLEKVDLNELTHGVEIIGTTKFVYPWDGSAQGITLLSYLKSLVNLEEIDTSNLFKPIPCNWTEDFEWSLIGKYTGVWSPFYQSHWPKEREIFQLVADCDNIILRAKCFSDGGYDDNGNCVEGFVPNSVHLGRANCSRVKSELPQVTNCEPKDFYRIVYYSSVGGKYTINIGVTWKGRPELVHYDEDFKKHEIGNKLSKIIKQKLHKSKLTRFDWSAVQETTNLVLMTKNTTELKMATHVSTDNDHELQLFQLVITCGEYLIYMPIVHKYETEGYGVKCIAGEFGWGCNEKFDNGTQFRPYTCKYKKGMLNCDFYRYSN